jgi:hypothetical protein
VPNKKGKPMRRLIFTALSTLLSISTFAQDFTLSGYLRDASTGEELLYATVSVEGTSQGVTTNLYGFYSLTLPKGSYQINFSYVGYETKTLSIDLTENITKDIELATASTN